MGKIKDLIEAAKDLFGNNSIENNDLALAGELGALYKSEKSLGGNRQAMEKAVSEIEYSKQVKNGEFIEKADGNNTKVANKHGGVRRKKDNKGTPTLELDEK